MVNELLESEERVTQDHFQSTLDVTVKLQQASQEASIAVDKEHGAMESSENNRVVKEVQVDDEEADIASASSSRKLLQVIESASSHNGSRGQNRRARGGVNSQSSKSRLSADSQRP